MGHPAVKHHSTVQQYLDAEETAVDKHEYHDGEVLAMSGGTYEHSLAIMNAGRALGSSLAGGPCRVLESNLRLRPGPASRYVYPDLSIVCGEPKFDPDDRRRTTITNAKVVIEVLSDSTEGYDRGDKFSLYRESPTLEEYVLISQYRPAIETFLRQLEGTWSFVSVTGIDAVARLRSLQVDLPLAEVYAGVTFPPPPGEMAGPEGRGNGAAGQ